LSASIKDLAKLPYDIAIILTREDEVVDYIEDDVVDELRGIDMTGLDGRYHLYVDRSYLPNCLYLITEYF
jgi:hypothetical protein